MKKKGFTLIELLAVIVILALVALISVPLVLGVIDRVQISSYKESLRSVFSATDLYIASSEFDVFPEEGINITDDRIQMKNKGFTSGKILKNDQGILELDKVSNGKYCAGGTFNDIVIIEGSCDQLDTTPPTITITSNLVTSSSITIVATAEDLESGINGYQFSKDNGATWTTKQISNVYNFTGLTNNTNYTFKVRVYNNNDLSTISEELVVTTVEIPLPTYSINTTDWSETKTVTITYPERQAGYVYEYSLDGAITWLLVEAPSTTKEITFTDNGSVIARITDGTNEISGASYAVTNIDDINPTVSFGTNGSTTYAKTRATLVTVSDLESGVNVGSLKYLWTTSTTVPSEGSFTSTFTNGNAITSPSGVTGGYYLWILASDNANNKVITRSNVFNLDNTIPVITVNPTTVTIEIRSTYTDTGVTASDNIDGNISGNIVTTGSVNTNAVGSYTLTYNVSDSSGNVAATKTRTVNVVDTTAPAIPTALAGTMLYTDPTFASGLNGTTVYNNTGNGNVTRTRVAISGYPAGSGYGLEIRTVGTASPGWGGFYFANPTAANKVFISRVVAKIPVGYTINWASNAYGTGGSIEWLTSQSGTGQWEEYIIRVNCGSSGTFSSTNFFYLLGGTTPTPENPLVWHVAYATAHDTTAWGTSNNIIIKATDEGTGIVGYGINQSSSTQPTYTTVPATSVLSTGLNDITANGTYYVWVKDAAGYITNKAVSVSYIDRTNPTLAFSMNGNATYAKSRSTTVTVSDAHSGVNASSLRYQWTTSTTAPSEASFTTTFTNGGSISTPAGVTGGYYLWILGKDNAGNTLITRSNVFNLDNTIPVITVNPTSVTIYRGSAYSNTGVTASDNINGNITANIVTTGSVNTNVVGSYTLTYNVSDSAGNAAATKTRTVNVVESVYNFAYTGNYQTFTAPVTGTYKLEVWGAQGGNITSYYPIEGGRGGYSTGNISLTAGQVVYVYVGGKGADRAGDHPYADCAYVAGGFNGGGAIYSKGNATPGGGGTDIRVGGTALNNRVIVAGGGGGGGWTYARGGAGGGLVGINGTSSNQSGTGAYGGSQSSGGSAGSAHGGCTKTSGSLGQGGTGSGYSAGGGGGGGYSDGGGGGSSYVGSLSSASTIAGNATMPNPSGGTMVGNAGNGYTRITFVG